MKSRIAIVVVITMISVLFSAGMSSSSTNPDRTNEAGTKPRVTAPARPLPKSAATKEADQKSNCDTAITKLKSRRAGDKKLAICTGPAPSPPNLKNMPTRGPLYPVPEWCIKNATKGPSWTRTDWCEIQNRTVSVLEWVNGAVVIRGSALYTQSDYWFTDTENAEWNAQQIINVTFVDSSISGLHIIGNWRCGGAPCTVTENVYPDQLFSVFQPISGYSSFKSDGLAPGDKKDLFSVVDRTFTYPGAISGQNGTGGGDVRCDQAVPGTTKQGCIFPSYSPVLVYSLEGPYGELAHHIKRAQESGLPGAYKENAPWYYEGLHRLADTSLKDKNGATACPARYPRPDNKQCDEYPFRSTYEGAFTQNKDYPNNPPPSWTVRTHPGCNINEATGVVDPDGYSVCMIDKWQNEQGGSELGKFYLANRVIEKDNFFVWIP